MENVAADAHYRIDDDLSLLVKKEVGSHHDFLSFCFSYGRCWCTSWKSFADY